VLSINQYLDYYFNQFTENHMTYSSTLKRPSKNYTFFISRRLGLFLMHLQSENKAD